MLIKHVLAGALTIFLLAILGPAALAAGTGDQATGAAAGQPLPLVIFPKTALTAYELGLVINTADPASVEVGEYYRQKRRIPKENVIQVRFTPGQPVMSEAEFREVKAEVDRRTPSWVQAFALAWTLPFRVECQSVTTAFAAGFDRAFCAEGCKPTKALPYFNSGSRKPWTDFHLRPSMLLAGSSVAEAKRLVDRGVASDATFPTGTGYLLDTSDKNRNVRSVEYQQLAQDQGETVAMEIVHADTLEERRDVLFYFTGLTWVKGIETNRFLPGAMADHLTSAGGILFGTGQMHVLSWLDAGATGSYGAVVEPCNFRQKFPSPAVAATRYIQGETLIEAYWKSVAMPGQGLFVGEPLASPFGGQKIERDGAGLIIHGRGLPPGRYAVLAAQSLTGPYRLVARGSILRPDRDTIRVDKARDEIYRIVPDDNAMAPSSRPVRRQP